MANWEGKTRGGLLGYKIFVFLIRYAGLRTAYGLLLFVAFYFVFFSPSASRSIYSFFRKRLGKSRRASLWGIYKTYWAFGQALIDRTAVLAGFGQQFSYDFDGEHYIQDMAKAGAGGILLSIHGGNWAMAGSMLEENVGQNARINIIMLEAEHQKIQAFLANIQVQQAANIIGIGDDFSHIIAMGSALRNGELLCMHGDRFLPKAETIAVNFLGETAHFPAGPFQLIHRMKVPYSFVFAFKETLRHYHFYATPGQQYPTSPQAAAQQFAHDIEKQLQKYPYQWYNFYDFWATPTTEKTSLQTNNG
ncbi:MAG: lipid A biosynthesis acyltransferase [Aureispira sp.]